ncbi:jg25778, partial [Pararge aegeria aegeria]
MRCRIFVAPSSLVMWSPTTNHYHRMNPLLAHYKTRVSSYNEKGLGRSPPRWPTLEVLESLAEGRSWWARLACLEFAQPLLFYGLPMLCAQADRAVRAERFALKLMRDPRVE